MAPPVLPGRPGRAGRRAAPGPPADIPRPGRGRGQGLGLRAARRQREAAGPLDLPRARPQAAAAGIVASVSASTVRRWLASDAIKPWQHRSWIFPRDPYFALKGGRVLDLYQREWEGQPLGTDEYVLSADEKPGVQARSRVQLPLPPGPHRAMRTESEYVRCGTIAYLAAYDVHRARVMGRCEPTTGINPFTALVGQVMQAEPSQTPALPAHPSDAAAGPQQHQDRTASMITNAATRAPPDTPGTSRKQIGRAHV